VLVLHQKGQSSRVDVVAFAPDGARVLACSAHGAALWSGFPGAPVRHLVSGWPYVRAAKFSPCGRFVAIAKDGVTVHDLSAGTSAVVPLPADWSAKFAFAPNGDLIVCQAVAHTIRSYLSRRAPENNWSEPRWARELAHSVETELAFVGDDRFAFAHRRWDMTTSRHICRYITCSADTGAELSSVEGPDVQGPQLRFEPHNRLLAGIINNRLVAVRADDCSAALANKKNDGPKHFTDLAFHPSGKYLALTSNDTTVKLYDAHTWEVARAFTWKAGRMRSVCFSPDGALAAAGTDKGQVIVWDVDF
jgi:WD40 repeat protein